VLDGAIDHALSTLEDALQANPEELIFDPNIPAPSWRTQVQDRSSRTS